MKKNLSKYTIESLFEEIEVEVKPPTFQERMIQMMVETEAIRAETEKIRLETEAIMRETETIQRETTIRLLGMIKEMKAKG